jgi:hypothetical protein
MATVRQSLIRDVLQGYDGGDPQMTEQFQELLQECKRDPLMSSIVFYTAALCRYWRAFRQCVTHLHIGPEPYLHYYTSWMSTFLNAGFDDTSVEFVLARVAPVMRPESLIAVMTHACCARLVVVMHWMERRGLGLNPRTIASCQQLRWDKYKKTKRSKCLRRLWITACVVV